MQTDNLKAQIEAKYDEADRRIETDDYAGQMTIAFCMAGDYFTEQCRADPECDIR